MKYFYILFSFSLIIRLILWFRFGIFVSTKYVVIFFIYIALSQSRRIESDNVQKMNTNHIISPSDKK